tara:strand:+ start:287 stop:478 length:192 start_codon:yes stop_codon:yes gene_type:complete
MRNAIVPPVVYELVLLKSKHFIYKKKFLHEKRRFLGFFLLFFLSKKWLKIKVKNNSAWLRLPV